jgi:hypothetical protein
VSKFIWNLTLAKNKERNREGDMEIKRGRETDSVNKDKIESERT